MPPVVLAAAATGAVSAVLGVSVLGLGAVASGFVIAGASLGLSLISQALAPDLPGFTVAARDRSITARATAEPKTLVIGEVALAGQLALFETTGATKEFLQIVVAHADHPIDAIDGWFANNDPVGTLDGDGNVTDGRFAGHLRLVPHTGTLDQAAAPNLVAEIANWTEDHKGGGVAYSEARLKWSADVWPNGFTGLRARVRGMPMYDPRDTGATITASDLASPAVFATDAPHGLTAGQQVWVKNHLGALRMVGGQAIRFEGKWHQIAAAPTTTTFTLIDLDGQPVAFSTAGAGGTVTAMAWSDNWALAVRMYLTHRATFNAQDDEIDDAVTIASANICDEQVALTPEAEAFTADAVLNRLTLAGARTWKTGDVARMTTTGTLPAPLATLTDYYVIRVDSATVALASSLANARARAEISLTDAGSGTHTATRVSQLRYTANGVVRLGQDPHRPLDEMMTAAAGIVATEGGVVKIHAGAATTATGATTESDMRDADLTVVPFLDRQKVFNAARGTFVDPDQYWTEGDLRPYANALYRAEDNGELIYRDFRFPFTTDPVMGQRLLKIALERVRQGATVTFPAKPRKYGTAVWDVEPLTVDHLGYAAKEFRVMGWAQRSDFGIDILYREEAPAVWDWALGDETTIDPAPNSNLPDALDVRPPTALAVAETLYDTRDGSGVKARAVVTWDAAADVFVTDGGGYDLRYRLVGAPDYILEPRDDDTRHEIDDIAPGTYEFEVRSVNSLGVHGAWISVTKEITGLGAAPADMAGLTLSISGGMAVARWDRHPDLDVREGGSFRFRHSPAFAGATLQASVSIGDPVDGDLTTVALPLKPGTYLARVFDSSGNPSAGIAMATTKQAALVAFTNTDTVFEHPLFVGAHSGTAGVDGVLKLGGGTLIDDWADFDAVADVDAEGGLLSAGTYDFASGMDFGSVVRRRITASITALVSNALDAIDDRSGLIDDWEDFDGVETGSADAQVWMRQTDDDPGGSPTWGAWHRLDSMEVEARGLDFQARLSSADPAYNILISQLTVDADEVA